VTNTNADADSRALQCLLAERAIRRVMVAYTIATDAKDVAGVRACFWPDATLDWEHLGVGPASEILPIVAVANDQFVHHQHNLLQDLIDVDPSGTSATSQTYGLAFLRCEPADARPFDMVVGVRYLDRHECRDGVWLIAHRTVKTPWMRRDEVADDAPLVPE
jgi:SnoaL-like domain